MSIPFRVEMPKVAVVPVSDPNSPITISVDCSAGWFPLQDVIIIVNATIAQRFIFMPLILWGIGG